MEGPLIEYATGPLDIIRITGPSDELGRMAAQALVADGHETILHARNSDRGREAMAAVPGASAVLIGDLASITQTRRLAEAANALGTFDAVTHNAAIGLRERRRMVTEDGLPRIFAINNAGSPHPDCPDPTAWSVSAPSCIAAAVRASTTCSGSVGRGEATSGSVTLTDPRPIPYDTEKGPNNRVCTGAPLGDAHRVHHAPRRNGLQKEHGASPLAG